MKREWLADMIFVEEEQRRIEPYTMQGEQSSMVQSDMKKWAVENEMWPSSEYVNIVDAHAAARGWAQEGFDEFMIVTPSDSFGY